MAIKPLIHRIVVKQDSLDSKDPAFAAARRAGIVVDFKEHDREQAAVDTGVVVSIGPTAFRDFNIEVPIKVGDVVAFAKYGGKVLTDPADNVKYVALNDEDVIAVLTTEGA